MPRSPQIVILALALAALLATGCGAAPAATVPAAGEATPGADLAGTRWVLVSMGPPSAQKPAVAGVEVTLEFGPDGQVTGSGGCNDYQTRVRIDGPSVSFSPVGSTKKACEGRGVMDQEQAFFRALESAAAWQIDGSHLTIRYDGDRGVLTLGRLPGAS